MASSVEPEEIVKFAALAAQWWDPQGAFGALHRMNPARLAYIRDAAARRFGGAPPLAGRSALDIGCGGGLVSAPLSRMGAKVTGIDAAAEAIGAAKAHAARAGVAVKYLCATAEELVGEGLRFDLVTALEIVEHVADPAAFLRSASALVAPGGLIVVSTINRTPKARALAIVGAERILKWAPEGAHAYEKLVTPQEIRDAATDIVWDAPCGISYNPLGSGWSLSRDVDVNYLLSGHKPA